MRNQKPLRARVLSLVLTAAMLFTTLPTTVFATEGNAALGTSNTEKTTRTITAFDELGEGFIKSMPFDGHTYALSVALNTPFEEIKLPTELGVTVEKTTTPPAKDDVVDSGKAPKDTPPPAPSDKLGAEATAQEDKVVDSGKAPEDNAVTTKEAILVTWKGDRAYTPAENSKVIYTAVLPEGYALKDGVALPQIYVMVGRQARAGAPVQRTIPLDLTKAGLSYLADDGTTTKTADPTTTNITDTGEGWSWNKDTKTLTLNSLTLDCSGSTVINKEAFGIKLADGAAIVSSGSNIIKSGNTNVAVNDFSSSRGIQGVGALTIKGSGLLDVTAGTGGGSIGIEVTSNLTITNTTVTATGGEATISGGASTGIDGRGDITCTDSIVTATGGKSKRYSVGINTITSAVFNGGVITLIGKEDSATGGMEGQCYAIGSSAITAIDATVTNGTADNGSFVSGTTKKLTHTDNAKPVVISFTKSISFDARNGATIADAEVGADMTLPADPTWTGYLFDGWYSGIDGTDAATSPAFTGKLDLAKAKTLTASTKVYAKWTKGSNTVRTETLDLIGSVTAAPDQGWTWDSTSKTLTLSGANISIVDDDKATSMTKAIVLPADTATVVINGQNSLHAESKGGSDQVYGIQANGSLTIKGSGILDIFTPDNNRGGSWGILVTNAATIQGSVKINITGAPVTGIRCGASLTITGGTVSAIGGRYGVFHSTSGTIIAEGATVTGAKEEFISGTTKTLTQISTDPVVISRLGPSITVAAQSGTATYGTATSPTFVVTGSSFGGLYPTFAPEVEWVGAAPAGVTAAFNGTNNETLTMTTTATTPAGEHKFKVVSPKTGGGNCESAEATLTVGKRTATITWGATTSFPYNGSSQAPTAVVSNKVTGDDVTVTVTGVQTNVGTGYIATVSALAGTEAGNYDMPNAGITKAFGITAKTVTVTDGDLEVKKPFDNTTSRGTATGKLGLTDVVGTEDVLVKINTVGAYADANVGKNKTVTLTISLDGTAKGNYTLGSVTTYSFAKAEITKVAYIGTAASAPDSTPENKGDKSITIKPVTPPTGENVEYAVSKTNTPPTSDSAWQTGTTFNNLDPNTEYFFFARVKENNNHAAGGESAGTSITTDKSVYTGTQATAPTATKTHNTVTLNTQTINGETVEYGMEKPDGTISWQDSPTFSGLNPNTAYKFYTRVKENDTHKAGATSASTAITTNPAPTTVSGNVKDSGNNGLDNVLVELKQGNTVIKSATTSGGGNYILNDVPAGVYKLVVTKGTAPNTVVTTQMITVAGTPITDKNVKFESGNKNTVVESKPGAPEVAVGGMNDLLNASNIGTTLTTEEKTAVDNGGSVELKFAADVKAASDVTADKRKIEAIATGKKIDLLLDLSVLKTVKDGAGTTISNGIKITTLADLIEVYLPIPAELQGKAGLSLYRVHNNKAEALSTTADGNGEYYTISGDGESMTLYIKNFSTYALGYTAFSVTLSGGGTDASGNGNYSNGDIVTINAGTKSGSSFSGWSVTAGTVTLADASSATTTFTMPSENVTVTANWRSNGGGGGGSSSSSGANPEYDFWMSAKEKIQTADAGDVIKINSNYYDKVPESLMDMLRKNNGVSLVITWNGKTITIPAGKAPKNEAGRIYWPLSMLAELYADITEDTVLKQAPQNPETGGPGEFIPVTDGGELITMDATEPATVNSLSNMADNAQATAPAQPITITPPDAGFEADAYAGTPDAIAARGINPVAVAASIMLLAGIGGVLVFLGKRRKEEQE